MLYRRHAERVWRYCLSFLRRPADAEDALQQTFLQAHRALERGVAPESETAWLLAIARNVCLTRADVHRRRRLAELPEDPHLLDEVLAAEEIESGVSDELREAFARLPERQRRALFLREWQECSYAEIAEALGTSESAVETLLVRARRTLARELAATRRRARDLAGLLGWLRTAIGSTAGKIAVGAAIVGAGAVGTGVTVTQSHHAARPATARHAHVVARPAVRRAVQPTRRTSPKTHGVVRVRHSGTAKRAVAPPPATPPAATPPVPTPSSPAPPGPAAPPPAASTPSPVSAPPAAQPASTPTATTTVSNVVTTATSTATSTATGAVSSTVGTAAQTVSDAVPAAAPVVTTAAQTVDQAASQTAQTVSDATQSVVTTVSNLLPGR